MLYEVIVIRHDSIDTYIDDNDVAERYYFIDDSLAFMFVAFAGVVIFSTQKGSSHTAVDVMVVRCEGDVDEYFCGQQSLFSPFLRDDEKSFFSFRYS